MFRIQARALYGHIFAKIVKKTQILKNRMHFIKSLYKSMPVQFSLKAAVNILIRF